MSAACRCRLESLQWEGLHPGCLWNTTGRPLVMGAGAENDTSGTYYLELGGLLGYMATENVTVLN